MRTIMRSIPILIAGIFIATTLQARTYSYTGPCDPVGNWLVIIVTDDNGVVTDREGVNCFGIPWRDHCSYHGVLPLELPTTSDRFEQIGAVAWIRFNLNGSGGVSRMWGETEAGEYWEADAVQSNLY